MTTRGLAVRVLVVLSGLVAVAGFSCLPVLAAPYHPYVSSFGAFSNVQGVAVDQAGDVYVYDGGAGKVLKYTATGEPAEFSSPKTNEISVGSSAGGEGEIAVDSSAGPAKGDIYIAHGGGNIEIYNAAGEAIGALSEEAGKPWGEACGVAVDSSGSVYVGLYNSHVNKYIPSSSPVTNADYSGSLWEVNNVCTIAADSTGNVFVDSWPSGPVTRYEASQFNVLETPAIGQQIDSEGSTLATDLSSNELYVDERSQVAQFGPHGEPFKAPILKFGGSGLINGSLGIAVSGFNQNVYVSTGEGGIAVFGKTVTVPDVTTDEPSNVRPTSATFNGSVNPDAVAVTDCKFEYGTTTAYGQSAPCAETVGSGTSHVVVHADVSGLTPGGSYHVKLVASNVNSSTSGGDRLFNTPAAPTISQQAIGAVGYTEATVTAKINPHNAPTTYRLEYGTSEAYGSSKPESEPVGADGEDHSVSVQLGDLQRGVTYHVRFVATNEVETVDGVDIAFSTYAPPTTSGGCANEQRREEQNTAFLPDCRAYEMVSPLDKQGGNVMGTGFNVLGAADGNRATYFSPVGFGETDGSGGAGFTQYLASREDGTGWSSHGITPTSEPESFQYLAGVTAIPLFSDDLRHGLALGVDLPAGRPDGIGAGENLYIEDTASGSLRPITTPLGESIQPRESSGLSSYIKGVSADLGVATYETSLNLLPQAKGGASKLYAWEHGSLTIAGILPDGSLPTGGSGSPRPGFLSAFISRRTGGVSRDGSHIAFISPMEGPGERQLYLRRDGASTAWVSQSEASVPNPEPKGVDFEWMTPDGKNVLFATTDRLLDSDPGGAQYALYMYKDSPDPESEANLTFIARLNGLSGGSEGAGDEAVTGVSEDGKRIYFHTEVSPGYPRTGEYLWDEGTVHFIATTSNPVGFEIWKGNRAEEAEVSPDGRELAFLNSQGLVPGAGRGNQLYLYNERDETLRCVSCLPTGGIAGSSAELRADASGAPTGTPELAEPLRFLAGDGRYVFFSTKEPLVGQDTDGVSDVYEYDVQTGKISLLSTGTGASGAWFESADETGENVFIATAQRLAPRDTDDLVDVYDVRVNGGFVEPKPETGGCVGDECQGVPASTPNFNTASGFSGLGNIALVGGSKAKIKDKSLTRAQKLVRGLKACRREPGKKRSHCEALARKRYGKKRIGKGTSRRARG